MTLYDSAFGYLRALLDRRAGRLARAWRGKDRGASAVELAVITAVILVVALFLLGVITRFVHHEAGKIHG